jgi:hypothetical protein
VEQEAAEEAKSAARITKLRAAFVEAGDNVNLFWLEQTLEGKTDLAEMARQSGRDVGEFYNAAKRRARIVARIVAEENGVKYDDSRSAKP